MGPTTGGKTEGLREVALAHLSSFFRNPLTDDSDEYASPSTNASMAPNANIHFFPIVVLRFQDSTLRADPAVVIPRVYCIDSSPCRS